MESNLVNYKNKQNKKIIGYFDYLSKNNNYFIIIPPAYGETKRDSLKLSYYLTKNGFNIIRYDATDHIGESQGNMVNATLSKMNGDLISTIDFVQNIFGIKQIGVVGTSLAVRVAIKAAAEDKRIKFLLGLISIVDLRSTLKAIYHQDIIGEIIQSHYKGKTIDDIMGFEVSINFAFSAIKERYHDLETTKEDMRKINIPVVLIHAKNDPWIDLNDVKSTLDFSLNSDKEFIVIPNAMHQLNENPEAVNFALRQTVVSCKKYLCNKNLKLEDVIEPSQDELSRQWLIEEERLKNLLKKNLEGEKEFWKKYLNKFVLIHKSPDYRTFLNTISNLLNIQPGEIVFDAGCGNGHFGAWLFEKMIEKIFKEKMDIKDFKPIEYIGLDFIEKNLKEAMLKHLNMTKRAYRELSLREKYLIIKYRYILSDMEYPLPLPENYFDKICCNLVISYVKNPQFSVNELMRVLKKGGKMIISSMKPYADLSQIYRNFVDKTENQEELEEARKLLSAAGRIKQKESAGFYKFYSEEELIRMIKKTNNKDVKTVRAFANQANIITVQKK